MDILTWIQQWYHSNCNGDWEHSYGIQIETVDNPGWFITIDLDGTPIANVAIDSGMIEKGPDDWYFYKIAEAKFEASGDCFKLSFLLEIFKGIAEQKRTS